MIAGQLHYVARLLRPCEAFLFLAERKAEEQPNLRKFEIMSPVQKKAAVSSVFNNLSALSVHSNNHG
jgi:hypothetical protein